MDSRSPPPRQKKPAYPPRAALILLLLLLTSGLLFLLEYHFDRATHRNQQHALSQLLADQLRPAILANDRDFAHTLLTFTAHSQQLQQLTLHRPDGSLFTHYQPPQQPALSGPILLRDSHHYHNGQLLITRRILLNEEPIALLTLESAANPSSRRQQRLALLLLLSASLATLLLTQFWRRVEQRNNTPLQRLGERLAQALHSRHPEAGEDPVPQLESLCDQLLTTVEQQEQQLQQHTHQLQEEIAAHTQDLAAINHSLEEDLAHCQTRQQRLLLLHETFDLAADGILLFDPASHHILYANKSFSELAGYDRNTLRKLLIHHLFPEYDEQVIQLATTAPEHHLLLESQLLTANQQLHLVELSLQAITPPAATTRLLAILHSTPSQPTTHHPVTTLPSNLPGIKIEDGLRRLLHDHSFYLRLLQRFHDRYRDIDLHIEQQLNSGDREAAWHTLHGIKGVAANLSMPTLQASAETLERSLRSSDVSEPQDFGDFRDALHQVLSGLDQLFSSSQRNTDLRQPQQLQQLAREIDGHSYHAIDMISQLQKQYHHYPATETLCDHLTHYRFHEAAETLTLLEEQIREKEDSRF